MQKQTGQSQQVLQLTFAKVKVLQDELATERAASASAAAQATDLKQLLSSVRDAAATAAQLASSNSAKVRTRLAAESNCLCVICSPA